MRLQVVPQPLGPELLQETALYVASQGLVPLIGFENHFRHALELEKRRRDGDMLVSVRTLDKEQTGSYHTRTYLAAAVLLEQRSERGALEADGEVVQHRLEVPHGLAYVKRGRS